MAHAIRDRTGSDPDGRADRRPDLCGDRRPTLALTPPVHRIGYLASAAINLGLLWVVAHLLEWGWPPFLTPDFVDLRPFIQLSLVVTVVVDLLWVWRDTPLAKHGGQLAMNVVGLVVVVRSWQIFPLDLSGYWAGWEVFARATLVVGLVGLVIGSIAEVVGLVRHAERSADRRPTA